MWEDDRKAAGECRLLFKGSILQSGWWHYVLVCLLLCMFVCWWCYNMARLMQYATSSSSSEMHCVGCQHQHQGCALGVHPAPQVVAVPGRRAVT
jgi:predicted Na+-dependent transporter